MTGTPFEIYAAGVVPGVIVTVNELYTAKQLELPQETFANSLVCPSVAITIDVGNVLCSWKAAINRSVST